MTHPELTIHRNQDMTGAVVALPSGSYREYFENGDFATRLVACWNACRDMDDPVAEIAKLREGNQSLLQKLSEADGMREIAESATDLRLVLSKRDQMISSMQSSLESKHREYELKLHEIDRLNNLVADRDLEVGRLNNEVCHLRAGEMVSVVSPVPRCTGGLSMEIGKQQTPEHLAYQLLRSLIISSAK